MNKSQNPLLPMAVILMLLLSSVALAGPAIFVSVARALIVLFHLLLIPVIFVGARRFIKDWRIQLTVALGGFLLIVYTSWFLQYFYQIYTPLLVVSEGVGRLSQLFSQTTLCLFVLGIGCLGLLYFWKLVMPNQPMQTK